MEPEQIIGWATLQETKRKQAAERALGNSLLPPNRTARSRSLASFGIPPVAGSLCRALFVGGENTVTLLSRVMEISLGFHWRLLVTLIAA